MYFKVKLLIWHQYKFQFLEIYLSDLRNSHKKVSLFKYT